MVLRIFRSRLLVPFSREIVFSIAFERMMVRLLGEAPVFLYIGHPFELCEKGSLFPHASEISWFQNTGFFPLPVLPVAIVVC